MKKTVLVTLLTSTLMMAQGTLFDFPPKSMGIALLGGVMEGEDSNKIESDGIYGVELSFPCLVNNHVRSQLQVVSYDNNGVEMLQVSVNPHYLIDLQKGVTLGVGPTLGATEVTVGDEDDTIFTYGVGASLRADLPYNFFIGTEAHYDWTTDAELGTVKDNFDNLKVFAKVGYSF